MMLPSTQKAPLHKIHSPRPCHSLNTPGDPSGNVTCPLLTRLPQWSLRNCFISKPNWKQQILHKEQLLRLYWTVGQLAASLTASLCREIVSILVLSLNPSQSSM